MSKNKWPRFFTSCSVLPFLLLGLGALSALILFFARASVPKTQRLVQGPIVEVVSPALESYKPKIEAYGTIIPKQSLQIRPQVSGHITYLNSKVVNGGVLDAGEILFQIDPRDYEFALEQERAALAQAQFELELEQANQLVAQREWELLGSQVESSEKGQALALRKPHIKAKKAALRAAQSRLEKAELDLARTEVSAPFRAVVRSERLEKGQFVSSQESLAELVALDAFYAQLNVPVKDLALIAFPQTDESASSKVRIFTDTQSASSRFRSARVLELLSDLDPNGRMARVLAVVQDPLHFEQGLPLLLDSYVRAEILSEKSFEGYRLPYTALREGQQVWLLGSDERLQMQAVEVLFSEEQYVFVQAKLPEGTQVIISSIQVPIEGMKLQAQTLRSENSQEERRQ